MGVISEVREFLESSTIHGLTHISTGKTAFVRILWAAIVIFCFCTGFSLIAQAFHSWELSPVITSVDTKPIGQVSFPEITLCPPQGSNTALNIDLVAMEDVELSEDDREKLIEATLTDLYSGSIAKFTEEQSDFHPVEVIKRVYGGRRDLRMAYTRPGSFYDGIWYPDYVTFEATANKDGALAGDYRTPGFGFGRNTSENTAFPSVEEVYKAYLPPQIFVKESESTTLVVELEYSTDPNPVPYGDIMKSEAYERVNFIKLDDKTSKYGKTGYIEKYNQTFEIDTRRPPRVCSFSIKFDRYGMKSKIGQQKSGFAVSWYLVNNDGQLVSNVDPSIQVPWCKEEDDGSSKMGEAMVRWFNILHHLTSVSQMNTDAVWKIVEAVKLYRLWKDDSPRCEAKEYEYTSEPKGNIMPEDIETLLGDIDEAGAFDSESVLSPEDLTEDVWRSGFQMFSYLAFCPSEEVQEWANFYIESLAESSVRGILEKVIVVLNKKAALEEDPSTETKLFSRLSAAITFKTGSAVTGISPRWALLEELDSPVMATVRDILKPCLENNTCEEVEKAVKSLSVKDYKMASHPVHILDDEGKKTPSAFIPFCSFGGNMEVLGKPTSNFSFPVCDVFYPRDVEGQLCFSLNLTAVKDLPKPDQGSSNGLTLALDYNTERSLQSGPIQTSSSEIGLKAVGASTDSGSKMVLLLDTLQPYKGVGPGDYILSSVKKVVSSEDFDKMSPAVQNCQFEQTWAECRRMLYITKATSLCGCYPSGMEQYGQTEMPTCLPNGTECYQKYKQPSDSCLIPCHGIYSDVEDKYDVSRHTILADTPGMEKLMEEYLAYKKGYMQDSVPYVYGWEPELKLHVVNIYFNTPTFDHITKDAKTNTMMQISVIGGTLGLFTGFSIMSGIEVLYYLIKIALIFMQKTKEKRKDLEREEKPATVALRKRIDQMFSQT